MCLMEYRQGERAGGYGVKSIFGVGVFERALLQNRVKLVMSIYD